MPFHIRRGVSGDAPVILDMIRGLAEYERAAPEQVPVTEEILASSLFGPKPEAEVLLGFEDETPAGIAIFFHNYSTWQGRHGLYLEDLFVKPAYRGRGYGKALLVELARIAQDRGCRRMEWRVLDWNTPAIEFYKSLGAAPLDEWTVFRMQPEAIATLAGQTRCDVPDSAAR